MKKRIVTFLLSLTMLFPLAACGEDDGLTEIRLSEVTHSIFYAPLYIAINNGYMTEAGIKIELSNGGGADKVMTAVLTGGSDIGLAGPEASIYASWVRRPPFIKQLHKRPSEKKKSPDCVGDIYTITDFFGYVKKSGCLYGMLFALSSNASTTISCLLISFLH